jgi:hypothetical protein
MHNAFSDASKRLLTIPWFSKTSTSGSRKIRIKAKTPISKVGRTVSGTTYP